MKHKKAPVIRRFFVTPKPPPMAVVIVSRQCHWDCINSLDHSPCSA
ncbi:hypothetical protein [Photobacterium halotolerans]|nr:hypothetical protein [Photobacterium halotolerans]